ncbi:hypothetical protein P7K49_013677 [Saguinus oedipus]|uniref:Thyroglobulin type-1 domain-containing protein n=1 Tax=Saguinus oedipus TaxID=9490 RepID=A0ABQ9VGL2_SAGOE|nr:hypothetical protein P7K49_013677 [Saguinus oedipus]
MLGGSGMKELAVLREKVTEQHRQMGKGSKHHLGAEEPKILRPPPARGDPQAECQKSLCHLLAITMGSPLPVQQLLLALGVWRVLCGPAILTPGVLCCVCSQTPCQQELDQVLERISTMRVPDERGPLEHLYSLHIPNCDRNGLYNLKQVSMVPAWA